MIQILFLPRILLPATPSGASPFRLDSFISEASIIEMLVDTIHSATQNWVYDDDYDAERWPRCYCSLTLSTVPQPASWLTDCSWNSVRLFWARNGLAWHRQWWCGAAWHEADGNINVISVQLASRHTGRCAFLLLHMPLNAVLISYEYEHLSRTKRVELGEAM